MPARVEVGKTTSSISKLRVRVRVSVYQKQPQLMILRQIQRDKRVMASFPAI